MTLKEKAQQYLITEEELREMIKEDIKEEFAAKNIENNGEITRLMASTIDQMIERRRSAAGMSSAKPASQTKEKPAETPVSDFIPPIGDLSDDDVNEQEESHASSDGDSEKTSEDFGKYMTPPEEKDEDAPSGETDNSSDTAVTAENKNEPAESAVPDVKPEDTEEDTAVEVSEDVSKDNDDTESTPDINTAPDDDANAETDAGDTGSESNTPTRKRKKKEQVQAELDTDIDEVPAVELRKFLAENFSVKPEKIFFLDDAGVKEKIDEKYAVIARGDRFFFIKRSYVIPVVERV